MKTKQIQKHPTIFQEIEEKIKYAEEQIATDKKAKEEKALQFQNYINSVSGPDTLETQIKLKYQFNQEAEKSIAETQYKTFQLTEYKKKLKEIKDELKSKNFNNEIDKVNEDIEQINDNIDLLFNILNEANKKAKEILENITPKYTIIANTIRKGYDYNSNYIFDARNRLIRMQDLIEKALQYSIHKDEVGGYEFGTLKIEPSLFHIAYFEHIKY